LREEPHLSLSETLRRKLAAVLAGQEVMQDRMRRAVAELNIGYRHSPIVAEHHSLLASSSGAHANLLGWHDFGAGPRAGDRGADARLVLCPGREPVRFFQKLRGTTHHLVLFAGALATGETHRRLQAMADATMRAYRNCIETHLIVPHELPEDLAGRGEYFWIRGASYTIAMELGVNVYMWSVPTAISASAANLPIPKR